MKIFLSKQCESLTGFLNRDYGYHIQHRKSGYYGVRKSKGPVPPDGHWRFILACTQLAQTRLHIDELSIHWMELSDALYTAHHFVANQQVRRNGVEGVKIYYNARDIINLKTTFGL